MHGYLGRLICGHAARRYTDISRGFVVEDDNCLRFRLPTNGRLAARDGAECQGTLTV